jgi:DNA-binding transcriptional LysR family regulator
MAARINLDLDTLRTFAVARDFKGLAQAAEQLGRTPSAISLQMLLFIRACRSSF